VTACRSGISRQLSEINVYCGGQWVSEQGREEDNEDCMKQLSNEDDAHEQLQVDNYREDKEEYKSE
jgi:hypothetical protein